MIDRATTVLNELYGVSSRDRGAVSEELVLEAAVSAKDRIPGVLGARLKTEDEDRRGIDIVVETTDGSVLLQVKSSHRKAREFKAKHALTPNAPMLFVVVASLDRACTERRVDGAIRAWLRQLKLRTEAPVEPTKPPKPPRPLSPIQAKRRAIHEARMKSEQEAAARRREERAATELARRAAEAADMEARRRTRAAAQAHREEEAARTRGARVAEDTARAARRAENEGNRARNIAFGLPSKAERRTLAATKPPRCHAYWTCGNLLDGYTSAWRRAEDGGGFCRACDAGLDQLHEELRQGPGAVDADGEAAA